MGNCINKSDTVSTSLINEEQSHSSVHNKSIIVNILFQDDLSNLNNKESLHNNSIDSNPDTHFDNLSTQNNISVDANELTDGSNSSTDSSANTDGSVKITSIVPCFTNSNESNTPNTGTNNLPAKSVDENDVSTPTIHYGKHIIMNGSNSYDKQEHD